MNLTKVKKTLPVIRDYLVAGVSILFIWEIASRLFSIRALPSPFAVSYSFITLLPRELKWHLLISTYRVVTSLVIALAIGIPTGLLLGRNKYFDRLLSPPILLVYPIPKIVFLPVVFVILGLGEASKLFLISLILIFQIIVTVRDAAKNISPQYIVSLVSLGGSELDLYRHVVIPAVLPNVFTALRISTGTAIAVLFFTETFATIEGVGYFIVDAWTRVAYIEMFAGIVGMSVLGLGVFLAVDFLEKRICAWKHQ
jgi:ABC-type nitrate/sulfonate/bicarbonate transport system permease component